MHIFFGIIILGIGIWMVAKPEMWCRVEDHFRIKGERTYSDTALFFMVLRGIMVSIGGLILFFIEI